MVKQICLNWKKLFFVIMTLYSINVLAQSPEAPDPLSTLYNSIKAQEANFPLPNTTQTITVGTVDVGDISGGSIQFYFSVPTYTNGQKYTAPNYNYDPNDDLVKVLHGPTQGGVITITNILHLNIRFEISSWSNLPATSLTIMLGNQSKTVEKGSTEVIFPDVTDKIPKISISVRGATNIFHKSIGSLGVPGLLPLKIDWNIVGAGAITIPVIPVSIVYAPVVDAQKKNQASTAKSITKGNTTSISFSTQNSTNVPIPSSFQTSVDMQKGMAQLGSVLSKIPNPYTQAIGAALTTISSGMGSSTATQNNSTTVSSAHTVSISNSESINQTAFASQGGPGEGDIISYYYNARVVWYSDNGTMRLAILGYDGFAHPTAGQLRKLLIKLKNSPHGTKDPEWHLDSNSVSSLLNLDPFVANNANAVLEPPRFVNISNGIVDIGGGELDLSFTHAITVTDINTITKTTTTIENDNAGFLSFLGVGVTDTKTMQSQISQSSSAQTSVGETFTQTYKLYGNGNEHYQCEIYFDVVFGAFAFRDVPSSNIVANVSGTLADKNNRPLPNSIVKIKAAGKTFITSTDSRGHFEFHIPSTAPKVLNVSGGSAKTVLNFKGESIKNIKLKE